MARKVEFADLEKPMFWALRVGFPFSKEVVKSLVRGYKRYALTRDGSWYRLWAE